MMWNHAEPGAAEAYTLLWSAYIGGSWEAVQAVQQLWDADKYGRSLEDRLEGMTVYYKDT